MTNNRDKLDDLFRDGLDGYRVEPSAGTWEKLEARFFPSPGYRRTFLFSSIIVVLLAGSTLVTWFSIPGRDLPETRLTAASTTQLSEASSNEQIDPDEDVTILETVATSTRIASSADPEIMSPANPAKYEDITDREMALASQSAVRKDPAEITGNAVVKASEPYTLTMENSLASTDRDHVHFMAAMGSQLSGLSYSLPAPLLPREFSVSLPVFKGLENEYARKYELSAGASFMPSVIFYDPNPNNNGWSSSVDITYSRSRLNLYLGAGVSRFKDNGSWRAEYETYDSVGYYMNVTSFRVDPQNPDEVIFELKREALYDSVPHVVIAEKTNSYTYLDIPVGIGLTIYNNRRLSFTINTGVKFSILVGKKEPVVEINISDVNEINMIREVPARLNTTWRFTAGLEMAYLLSDRLSICLEPKYEQYLQSVYISESAYQARKPYLIGVNFGLRYRIK